MDLEHERLKIDESNIQLYFYDDQEFNEKTRLVMEAEIMGIDPCSHEMMVLNTSAGRSSHRDDCHRSFNSSIEHSAQLN